MNALYIVYIYCVCDPYSGIIEKKLHPQWLIKCLILLWPKCLTKCLLKCSSLTLMIHLWHPWPVTVCQLMIIFLLHLWYSWLFTIMCVTHLCHASRPTLTCVLHLWYPWRLLTCVIIFVIHVYSHVMNVPIYWHTFKNTKILFWIFFYKYHIIRYLRGFVQVFQGICPGISGKLSRNRPGISGDTKYWNWKLKLQILIVIQELAPNSTIIGHGDWEEWSDATNRPHLLRCVGSD